MGIPGKVVRDVSEKDLAYMAWLAGHYVEQAERYVRGEIRQHWEVRGQKAQRDGRRWRHGGAGGSEGGGAFQAWRWSKKVGTWRGWARNRVRPAGRDLRFSMEVSPERTRMGSSW